MMAPIERQAAARSGEGSYGICDPKLYRSQPWHAAYMAALFETDRSIVGDRITSAEQLIQARAKELHDGPTDRAERNLLNNALGGLRALRICLHLQRMPPPAKCA